MNAIVQRGRAVLERRLSDELRRCLRPLNMLDEVASLLPAHARAPTATATEAARRLLVLRSLRFPVRRVAGVVAGTAVPLRATLAMDARSAQYWRSVLFEDGARETSAGDVGATEVIERAADEAEADDIALWRLAWPLGRTVRDALVVPSHVPFWLDTSRPFDAIVAGDSMGRHSRKNDVRRARKLGLTERVTRDPAEHERFRRDYYEPYTRTRFGATSQIIPPHVFRHARRQGWLLALEQDRGMVAGALFERWRSDYRTLAFGVQRDTVDTGQALAACYCHAIRLAAEHGWSRLGLGNVRPVATDGVYRYKRKWGAALGRPYTWDGWLLVCRNTPRVRAALAVAPIVAMADDRMLLLASLGAGQDYGALAGIDTPGLDEIRLFAADAADAAGIETRYTPLRTIAPDARADGRP